MTKLEMHKSISKTLGDIYERKNKDYGDSFAKARKEIRDYTLGKLYDKFSRYKNLTQNENKNLVKDETIEDTLVDMANYCIMELIELQIDKQKRKKEEVK